MGNVCGKTDSGGDNFAGPGRVIGTAPPQPQRAAVPQKVRTVGGPPRTLGGSQDAGAGAARPDDARRKAAEAAEARAKAASKTTGKLSAQLQEQKKKTRNETLKEISQNELRARDADEAAQARSHN